MSRATPQIDYKRLELELEEALKADELYKLQNDAKLRAVEQKVPTYEHFRQMVNGAHLKPLERGDDKPKVATWNRVTADNDPSTTSTLAKTGKYEDVGESKIPETQDEFLRSWEQMGSHEKKFAYLRSTRDRLREKIFRIEVPPMLLNDLINVCLKHVVVTDDVESVAEILQILSSCNRFRLTVSFLTANEKIVCSRLFRELIRKEKCQDESLASVIESLSESYGVALKQRAPAAS